MSQFQDKYRIESTRLKGWDYGSAGWYFVTICTQDRAPCFGEVVAHYVQLSTIGVVAHGCWAEIPTHFSHVDVDEFVIMPNHVHGIVVIQHSSDSVETRHGASLQPVGNELSARKFGPLQSGSLPAVINAYKSSVTRLCRKVGQYHFAWQAGYYEHIIRNDQDLDHIRQYICDNPAKWETDHDNVAELWM